MDRRKHVKRKLEFEQSEAQAAHRRGDMLLCLQVLMEIIIVIDS